MTEQQPLLKVVDLHKHFGGLVAVDKVSMEVHPGEVVGLVGDNGAGKSTLIKMVSGVYRPDGGQIFLEGQEVRFDTPMEARDRGIETIYQDLALCENLDASVNIFLGREPMRRQLGLFQTVDRKHMLAESKTALDQLDIEIPNLLRPMREMSGGQRQAVAIARAVYWNARLMIMDEPTAALAVAEQRKVLDLCRTLRDQGVPVLIISHNLLDVFAVADRIVVLRRARKVAELNAQETSMDEVVALMTGSKVGDV
jgi:simple sugar transport system ATP-binding protein